MEHSWLAGQSRDTANGSRECNLGAEKSWVSGWVAVCAALVTVASRLPCGGCLVSRGCLGCSWVLMGSCHRENAPFLEQLRAIGELRRLIGPERIPCYARALHLHIGRCVSPNKAKVRREAFHHRGFSAGYRTPFRIASDIDETPLARGAAGPAD
ncbi:uncharacterized protein TrAFT101_007042 [Trichoderma asperellum]|uniref:uncharacterized protein n=1 Tax=Trichoderma asperellum TaxID=101201 RepID=UPI00332F8CB9|nr:hypothetical protein TrAFT101_007042 [Trichoderma asperellum]